MMKSWVKSGTAPIEKKPGAPKIVGTEAAAKRNLERNKKDFRYPPSGFATPIEHSLIYSMLSAPRVYPDDAIIQVIKDEDYEQYMLVNPPSTGTGSSSFREKDNEPHYSYAQLSALLTLAAIMYPAPTTEFGIAGDKNTVPQVLCRTLLKAVIRHAEANELDRESEVKELLEPLQRVTVEKDNQQTALFLVSTYLGFGLSVATANPLPMYVGWMIGGAVSAPQMQELNNQAGNLQQLKSETDRMANPEKTGLLDETDD